MSAVMTCMRDVLIYNTAGMETQQKSLPLSLPYEWNMLNEMDSKGLFH